MAEYLFRKNGELKEIIELMEKVRNLARKTGCEFREGHFPDNGKEFFVSGKRKNLWQFFEGLKRRKLPIGVLFPRKRRIHKPKSIKKLLD